MTRYALVVISILWASVALAQTGPSGGGSSAPAGAAAGDLSGTYPNPGVAKLNGTAVTAPASGLLVGTTDAQTITTKTITGSTLDSSVIGGSTPAAASVTTINHSGVEIAAGCMDFQAPSTGGTVSIAAGICEEMIAPAGTLATLTTNLIAAPVNGQKLKIRFTQVITALTIGAGGANSIVGNPTTAALGLVIDCIYRTSNTTWYC